MLTTKPKKKIAFQTQHNAFSPVISYVNTGRKVTVEKRFTYLDESFASMAHAERMAGEGGRFMWIEEEVSSSGRKRYIFVFNVEQFEFEQV